MTEVNQAVSEAAKALSKMAYAKQFGGKTKEEISEHMKRVRRGAKIKVK